MFFLGGGGLAGHSGPRSQHAGSLDGRADARLAVVFGSVWLAVPGERVSGKFQLPATLNPKPLSLNSKP